MGILSGTTAWCLTAWSCEVDMALVGRQTVEVFGRYEVRLPVERRGLCAELLRAPLVVPATFLLARLATDEAATAMSAQPIRRARHPHSR